MSHLRQLWHHYRAHRDDRLRLSLRLSFSVHLVYIAYKSIFAVLYRSPWLGATAVYYMALCAARCLLLRGTGSGRRSLLHDWQTYRFCGGMLLALTLAIAGVNLYTIRDGQAMHYPWHLIYGAAAYTFYSLTMALIWLLRKRKRDTPLHSANRLLSLSAALVALFSLQMALLAAFGDGSAWERPMNIATGSVVFLLVAVIALSMLRTGTAELQALKHREKDTESQI